MSCSTRILIVRVGAMGDVLHALPAVSALRAALPSATIGWAIEPRWAALLRSLSEPEAVAGSFAMPLVDTVHLVRTRAWSRAPLSLGTARSVLLLRKELCAQRYDLAIDLQGSIRSAVIAQISGAGRTVGCSAPREPAARWLYTERVATAEEHVIEQAAEIVSHAVGRHLLPVLPMLPIDADAERWADTLLREIPDRRVVLLAPSAGWGAKQWPAERYGAVAGELDRAGYRVLINTVSDDDPLALRVVQASGDRACAVACSLDELVSLVRRASLVIAGDTGPLHLAAAVQTPVVALFGPTDPLRTGPYGTASRTLRHGASRTDHRRHAITEGGLQRISVEEVLAAASDLLCRSA